MLASLSDSVRNAAREFSELERLMAPDNKQLRTLVFFAESGIYYRYYEDYIEQILNRSPLDICYLASDASDPIFALTNDRIKPFYIKHSLSAALSRLDSKVLVIATPDLNNGPIKRAPDTVHHVYAFRGISSTHQAYKLGAFDHYDSILCVGPYQMQEIRKTEEIYGLKPKQLVLTGYPLVDRIYRQHQIYKTKTQSQNQPICLIAPTWGPSSLMEVCLQPMLKELADTKFKVWLRPHPEYAKRKPKEISSWQKIAGKTKNITVELELSSMECIHQADLLITDHSSIAMDYFFGTERPVMYVNTPTRIDNPECDKLGMEPVENVYRDKIGDCLMPGDMTDLPARLEALMHNRARYLQSLPAIRESLVANWQHSAQVGAEYILSLCQ